MDILELRYSLAPQMREYDRMGENWLPYVMFFQRANYTSSVVNTDTRGFRWTYKNDQVMRDFHYDQGLPVSVLIGSSAVFGVGATHDRQTMASRLNAQTDDLWVNFGGRAYNSTQELLLFLFHHHRLKNIKRVVIYSGLNNIVTSFFSEDEYLEYGKFFHCNTFNKQLNYKTIAFKRRMILSLMNFISDNKLGTAIDYKYISRKDLLKAIFKSKRSEKSSINTNELNGAAENKLLDIFNRDLLNWKILSNSMGFELYYILQPFATWMMKEKSSEEEQLFSALDNYQKVWARLLKKIDGTYYQWFAQGLQDICDKSGITFIDLNKKLPAANIDREWIFVDRIHLTDRGYDQVAQIVRDEVRS